MDKTMFRKLLAAAAICSVILIDAMATAQVRQTRKANTLPYDVVSGDPPVSVPDIARVFGIRVGVNGRDRLERRLGQGIYSVGGHSNGVETWITDNSECQLVTEGFEHNREGEVVTYLEWTYQGSKNVKKRSRAGKNGWLKKIEPGISRQETLALLPANMKPAHPEQNMWQWTHSGFLRPNAVNEDVYTDWKATLEFKHNRLVIIRVTCEGGLSQPGSGKVR